MKPMPKHTPYKVDKDKKKVVIAVTLDPDLIEWAKEWAAKRDRSFSWALNYFARERKNRELAEKHLGQKVCKR